MLMMTCADASEQAVSQWASTFAETSLHISKTLGDLGCSGGPTLAGLVSSYAGGNLKIGILTAIIFPAVLLLGLISSKKSE